MGDLTTVQGQQQVLQGISFACDILHPNQSCDENLIAVLPRMIKYFSKVYLPVHLIPFIIYKRKQLKKKYFLIQNKKFISPIDTLKKSLFAYMKSIAFLCLMVQGIRLNWCLQKNYRKAIDGFIPFSGGLMSGFSLLLESNSRAQEIYLSIVPRFCEILLNYVKDRLKLKINFPNGDSLVFAFVLAILHYYYQNEKQKNSPKQ
ncbi:hypothetical protein pb186bvf_005636 [Paramecium bursaria]